MLKAQLNNLPPERFLDRWQSSPKAILIDVRTPAEFASGHFDHAINIDYLSEHFWEEIEKLPTENSYFIYCRSGRRSIRACTLMRNGGFDNQKLFNMDGGYKLWLEQQNGQLHS